MIARLLRLLALALALAPLSSYAIAPKSGPEMALRLGYGLDFGSLSDTTSSEELNAVMSALIPVQFDFVWGLPRGLELGGYGSWGLGQGRLECGDCTFQNLRVGLQANWRFFPVYSDMSPWIGLAGGLEHASLDVSGYTLAYSGWDATLQAGADFRYGGCFDVGPVLSLTTGVYRHLDVTSGTRTGSEDIRYQTPHYWLTFGVRGGFGGTCASSPKKD